MTAPSGNRDQELRDLLAFARQHGARSADLDEIVHEVVSRQATEINNGGLQAQLSYLIDAIGPAQARAMVQAGPGRNDEQPAQYGTPPGGELP